MIPFSECPLSVCVLYDIFLSVWRWAAFIEGRRTAEGQKRNEIIEFSSVTIQRCVMFYPIWAICEHSDLPNSNSLPMVRGLSVFYIDMLQVKLEKRLCKKRIFCSLAFAFKCISILACSDFWTPLSLHKDLAFISNRHLRVAKSCDKSSAMGLTQVFE